MYRVGKRSGVPNVAGDRLGFATALDDTLLRLLQLRERAPQQCHARAGRSERKRYAMADALSAPGDDRDFSDETPHDW